MGSFHREGTFRDRDAFLTALRAKIDRLRDGALRGLEAEWTEDGGTTQALLRGFGARVTFRVGESSWTCDAEVPSWLPIPLSTIEEKFDREFKDLAEPP